MRLGWNVIAFAAACAVSSATQAIAATHTGPVSDCYCSATEPATGSCTDVFGKGNKSYESWRRHAEILEFDGVTSSNQTFSRTIRNVTAEDDVYLRVRLERPLRYGFTVTLTQ